MHLVYMLLICGLQIKIFNLFWTHVGTTYCTSYITKIDKSITSQSHSIIKKCITNNIDANTRIQKLGNVFLNAQQMVVQLVVYLVFSLQLYHSSQTFQFINTSPFKKQLLC
jgi:hypothetical protein